MRKELIECRVFLGRSGVGALTDWLRAGNHEAVSHGRPGGVTFGSALRPPRRRGSLGDPVAGWFGFLVGGASVRI